MKHIASITCLAVGIVWLAITATSVFAEASQQSSAPIPMDQLGAVAGKQYQGDGLSVIATTGGASLRCAFQRARRSGDARRTLAQFHCGQ